MVQSDAVQFDFAQGGGRLTSVTSIADRLATAAVRIPVGSKPKITVGVNDVDWDAAGKEVITRVYRTVAGRRELVFEGAVSTGQTTVKGVPQAAKKPSVAMIDSDCDLDVEVVVSGQLSAFVDVSV